MWNIFKSNYDSYLDTIENINYWADDTYNMLDKELKIYFAEKVTLNFDYKMIFNQKDGVHNNLLESLSIAEKEMSKSNILFEDIWIYLLNENNLSFLITKFLSKREDLFPIVKFKFQKIIEEVLPNNNQNYQEKLSSYCWSKLVFSPKLSNFAKDWINFMPDLEKRSLLQAKNILTQMHFKDKNPTLMEEIEFYSNIDSDQRLEKVYEKVKRIIPKIESNMYSEWNHNLDNNYTPNIFKNRTN